MVKNETKTIYRLERDNGEPVGFGPYNGDCDLNVIDRLHDAHDFDDDGRPNVREDFHSQGGIKFSELMEMYCACPTLDYLLWWFEGFVDELLDAGFNVVEYVVQDCLEGASGKQVMFHPDKIVSARVIF